MKTRLLTIIIALCLTSCAKEYPDEITITPEVFECHYCGAVVNKSYADYMDGPTRGFYVCPVCRHTNQQPTN